MEINNKDYPSLNQTDFSTLLFCQALSLACNSAIQISLATEFLAEDRLYNLSPGISGGISSAFGPFSDSVEVEEDQIEEAKRLYDILVNPDSETPEKLRISINRWIKSKTPGSIVDKIIDLGIALEALYVPDGGSGEIRFKFAVRAAWHLGKDKEDRNKLMTKFKQIYDRRSNAVHSGKLDETVRFGNERIPALDFMKKVQDLCRDSIKKILEDGEFPDWDSLILGGEDEQESS